MGPTQYSLFSFILPSAHSLYWGCHHLSPKDFKPCCFLFSTDGCLGRNDSRLARLGREGIALDKEAWLVTDPTQAKYTPFSIAFIFRRPGVARASLKTLQSFIHGFAESPFSYPVHCTLSLHPNLWFGCTEMRRLTILTARLVRTQETITISQSEKTYLILTAFLVRNLGNH